MGKNVPAGEKIMSGVRMHMPRWEHSWEESELTRWCRKAAAGGNADAELLLGLMERYGSGDVNDSREAEELLTKAAEQGSPVAEAALGEIFDSREDYAKAAELYRKAAEHGLP